MAVDDYRFRKRPAESRPFGFDFAADLGSETIVSATFTIEGLDGANASGMLSGSAVVDGTIVKQRIVGGVVGLYRLTATATTTAANTLEAAAALRVET